MNWFSVVLISWASVRAQSSSSPDKTDGNTSIELSDSSFIAPKLLDALNLLNLFSARR